MPTSGSVYDDFVYDLRGYSVEIAVALDYGRHGYGVVVTSSLSWHGETFVTAARTADDDDTLDEIIIEQLGDLVDRFDAFLRSNGLPYFANP